MVLPCLACVCVRGCVCACPVYVSVLGSPLWGVLWDLRLKDNNPAESLVSGGCQRSFPGFTGRRIQDPRELTRGHYTVFPVLKEMRK